MSGEWQATELFQFCCLKQEAVVSASLKEFVEEQLKPFPWPEVL